jgi:hypothetical protein
MYAKVKQYLISLFTFKFNLFVNYGQISPHFWVYISVYMLHTQEVKLP